VFTFFLLLIACFFYKTFLHGYVPFPGDLLIAEYKPWSTYSYLGYNPGSYPNKAQYFDVLRQLYPWKTFVIHSLKTGNIPLWNPFNFSGSPLLANFQSGVFYPFNLVYFIFPFIVAWSLLIILQPFLAGLFTYFYGKKIGLSPGGSFFAGIAYAFSSFAIVWLEYNTIGHVIMWLPLALLSVEELLQKKRYLWIYVFIFSLVSSLFAGHLQIFFYEYIFVVIYVVYRLFHVRQTKQSSQNEIVDNVLLWVALFSIPLFVGAIQLIPGFELISQSARSNHAYDFIIHKILIQPWQLVMFFVPDFFGNPATRNYWIHDTYVGKVTSIGIVAIPFILLAFYQGKNIFVKFFTCSAFIILLVITNNPLTALLYSFSIPFISSSAPTLAVFLFCFTLAILAGFGINVWQKDQIPRRKIFFTLAVLGGIFLLIWISTLLFRGHFDNISLSIAHKNVLYATAISFLTIILILIGLYKKNVKIVLLIILVSLHIGDTWRSFEKFNPFVPQDLVFPQTPVTQYLKEQTGINRFWGYGSAGIEANFATQYQLFSSDGYDPLYSKQYGEFIQSSQDGKIHTDFTKENRSDAKISQGFGETDFSANQYRIKILNLVGTKYIIDRVENGSTSKTFPPEQFQLVYEKDGWKILKNLKVTPRAFMTSNYHLFKGAKEFEKKFFAKDFDPTKEVLLEQEPQGVSLKPDAKSEVSLVSYTPSKATFNTTSSADTLLFLSDTFSSGWDGKIDGKYAPVYRANYAFRVIPVPAGTHIVSFTYLPQSYKIGATISSASICALALLGVYLFFQKQRYNKKRRE